MLNVVIQKREARERGLVRYFTGLPCRNGHVSERRVVGGHCIACVESAQFAWRERLGPAGLSSIVRRIWDRSGGLCAACGGSGSLELDHIKALANGGDNRESNLQFLCTPCNRSKGTNIYAEWLARRQKKELQHAA